MTSPTDAEIVALVGIRANEVMPPVGMHLTQRVQLSTSIGQVFLTRPRRSNTEGSLVALTQVIHRRRGDEVGREEVAWCGSDLHQALQLELLLCIHHCRSLPTSQGYTCLRTKTNRHRA